MLLILIHNDGTGTHEDSHYEAEVRINLRPIWEGYITGHNRSLPWWELVDKIVKEARAMIDTTTQDEIMPLKRVQDSSVCQPRMDVGVEPEEES